MPGMELDPEAEKPKLLIVDDDPLGLSVLVRIFADRYRVSVAARGDECLAAARDSPDLILLDFRLPDMDGITICAELKRDPATRNIPILLVTSSQEPDVEVEGIRNGAVDFVAKPFSVPALQERVRAHIARRREIAYLSSLAATDALTGLPNRRCFDETLQQERDRSRRERMPLSLILIDIDHFKSINDTYGHQNGDACIKAVAALLRTVERRPGDLVARFGGEEFAAILPNTHTQGAIHVGELIRGKIEAADWSFLDPSGRLRVNVSVGCGTIAPTDLSPIEALLRQADDNLYRAKRNGRNRVEPPFVLLPQD